MTGGYIDPRIVPDTQREHALLAEVRRRGLSAHRLHRDGGAIRVTGGGVWLTVAALRDISPSDLDPVVDASEVLRREAYADKGAEQSSHGRPPSARPLRRP
jgi:hypothetical protein